MPDKYDMPSVLGSLDQGRFHIMAKPVSSTCNLDCKYCYYLSKERLQSGPGSGRMSDEVLENFIRQYIEAVSGPEVVFTWQGGEPTLRGIEFFKKALALQKKHAKPGQKVENDLQTNGTLIDEAWCEFLKENKFLVGLSIDGPRELHDAYRVQKNGQPTFDRVVRAAALLRRFDVPFNTLTCVNHLNAKRPREVYRFLREELDSTYIQFIPIVEHTKFEAVAPQSWCTDNLPTDGTPEARPGNPGSVVTEWSVDPYDYGEFLCKTFDEWYKKDAGKVLVNHFESLLAQHLGMPSQMCVYHEFCGKNLAVEHDGSLYACDHYVYPEFRRGNVNEQKLSKLVLTREQVKFGYAKSETLPAQCRECAYLKDCWGECPKNRIIYTKDGEAGLNYLCRGLKIYFQHALPKVEKIVARLKARATNPLPRLPG